MRTAQELFDTIVTHLRTQGRLCITLAGCAYRGDEGSMCAIGCLIPNEAYSSDMEGKSIIGLLCSDLLPESLKNELKAHDRLLTSMQDIHDRCTVSSWEDEFKRVAHEYDLLYSEKNK